MDAVIDAKGRIMLPKELRKQMGLGSGKKVKVNLQDGRIVITPPIEPELFAKKMRGFVKEGSNLESLDPIELKRIWE